jgi:hypothetical protein
MHLTLAFLCLGCGLGTEVENGATTRAADQEIPGTHAPDDLDPYTAQRWIDHVMVGRELDVNESVPSAGVTNSFATDDQIHVSMEVTDAPAGSVVAMTVINGLTGEQVWHEEKPIQAGRSHLAFSLDADDLGAGRYRAAVTVGDEEVANRAFVVNESKA